MSLRKTHQEYVQPTAPFDPRFPSLNQTKRCWALYIEQHTCYKKKGKKDPECRKFKRWARQICAPHWIEEWDELREEGNFPGPL